MSDVMRMSDEEFDADFRAWQRGERVRGEFLDEALRARESEVAIAGARDRIAAERNAALDVLGHLVGFYEIPKVVTPIVLKPALERATGLLKKTGRR